MTYLSKQSNTAFAALSDRPSNSDVLEARFGRKAASYLSEAAEQLPHPVSERLRVARMQALAQHRTAQKPQPAFGWLAWLHTALLGSAATATSASVSSSGRSGVGSSPQDAFDTDEPLSWRGRVATALPLVVLVAGLFMISAAQQDNRALEIAEIDAALLTDTLPPSAFADTGFLQFLKTGN